MHKSFLKSTRIFVCVSLLCLSLHSVALAAEAQKVKIETSFGNMVVELYEQKAPKTVANFKQYVADGYYNGTIFHRVIDTFMIQGGGFLSDMRPKETRAPIINEANNGLSNTKYTLAMARTPDPNSASSQFFINTVDNPFLNYKASTAQGWGYCVFGKVIEGQAVVDKIKKVATMRRGGHSDVPSEPVVIQKATLID